MNIKKQRLPCRQSLSTLSESGKLLALMYHKRAIHSVTGIALVGNARIAGATVVIYVAVVSFGKLQHLQVACIDDFVITGVPDVEFLLSQVIQFPEHLCNLLYTSSVIIIHVVYPPDFPLLRVFYNSNPLLHKLYHILHKKANQLLLIFSSISSLLFLSM